MDRKTEAEWDNLTCSANESFAKSCAVTVTIDTQNISLHRQIVDDYDIGETVSRPWALWTEMTFKAAITSSRLAMCLAEEWLFLLLLLILRTSITTWIFFTADNSEEEDDSDGDVCSVGEASFSESTVR